MFLLKILKKLPLKSSNDDKRMRKGMLSEKEKIKYNNIIKRYKK